MGLIKKVRCRRIRTTFLILFTFSLIVNLMIHGILSRDPDVGVLHAFLSNGIGVTQSAVGSQENTTDVTYDVDYIPEDTALQLPACEDYKLSADFEKSRLSLLEATANYKAALLLHLLLPSDHITRRQALSACVAAVKSRMYFVLSAVIYTFWSFGIMKKPVKKTFTLGDTFSVSIRLYDGYGAPISRGGADVRPRMFDMHRKAYGTAPVTDHGNGTYTATFRAMWVGHPIIKVKIAHTPEDIRAIYYVRRKLRSTREIEGRFTVDNINETTLCHPTRDALISAGYSQICNLTWDNSGMSWYCGKPRHVRLVCEDWTGCNTKLKFPDLPLTPCESTLLKRSGIDMNQTIEVTVKPGQRSKIIVQDPSNSCRHYSRKALWTLKQPTGFMYNGTWHLGHCKGYDNKKLFSCLRNKSILIFGDSTTRQWYQRVLIKLHCSPTSERWTYDKWHKRASCANKNHNFTVQWLPHSQPFFGVDTNRYTRTSIARHLDETGSDVQVIAIIHIYLHTLAYHHSVFRERIRRLRPSVQNLLNRNRHAKVLVKGFQRFYDETRILNDYYGKVYKHILFEEFAGLHDRVVYLDQKDISDAVNVLTRHPGTNIVAAMFDQMLSYIC